MTNKYVSKIVAGGNTLYVKDAEAREALTSKVDVDSALNNVAYDSTNKKLTKTVGSTTSDIVSVATIKSDLQLSKSDVGLGNVTNDAQVKRSEMGSASGVAQLDENGKVPSSQLPSYVDDVIEGYYNDSKFYTTYTPGEEEGDPDTYSGEITAESGKIYVDKASNLSYRWSGSAFIGISSPLALGETASTAYAGDKGKAVTDNFNTHAANNDIHVTAADKTAWNAKSTFSGNYNDLTNKPTIPTKTSDLTNDSNFVGAQIEIGTSEPTDADVMLFVDTTESSTVGIYSKTQADNRFVMVVDLSSAPTSSTISYTENNVSVNFKVGDEVRVADANEDTGYKYYKLYALTTENNTTTATWDVLGSDINLVEYLTVSLTSNQTNPNSDLIGATVVITDTEELTTLFSTTWQGTALEFEIPVSIDYKITVGDITGYATPAAVTYTALLNKSRTVSFIYNTEILTVTIDKDGGSADISAQTVVVKDASNNTLGTLTNGQSLKIPYGVVYTATASDISTADYSRPSPYYVTKNWSDTPEKSLTFTYRYIADAVDLGLPSGLLWAKKNVGASVPTDIGNLYTWGNTTPWTSSEVYDNTPGAVYKTSSIPLSADAVRVNMGSPWRMPTEQECNELKNNTTQVQAGDKSYWTVTSNTNGKSVIFPTNGWVGHTGCSTYGGGNYPYHSLSSGQGYFQPTNSGNYDTSRMMRGVR